MQASPGRIELLSPRVQYVLLVHLVGVPYGLPPAALLLLPLSAATLLLPLSAATLLLLLPLSAATLLLPSTPAATLPLPMEASGVADDPSEATIGALGEPPSI
jgi:hypothetical protein